MVNHDDYRVALYYCYVTIVDVPEHIQIQSSLCRKFELMGRIRVSSEGINGVVSGQLRNLEEYERQVRDEFDSLTTDLDLDVKYCLLRRDLTVEDQLFKSLSIKATREVISLFEPFKEPNTEHDLTRKPSGRRHKKNATSKESSSSVVPRNLDSFKSAPHLTPQEWQEALLKHGKDSILVDARNIYESNVGRFEVEGVPTLLTNTRKYSSALPQVLQNHKELFAGRHVMMYCTGGVRCERASAFLQGLVEQDWGTLEPPRGIYQLQGGIQRYLEKFGNDVQDDIRLGSCLFKGKNFVFDPRRTDPVIGKEVVGTCLLCGVPHDDYDNSHASHAPTEGNEARCCHCRVLVLVCNDCRSQVQSFGEESQGRQPLYCGGLRCVDQGNSVEQAEVIRN